METFFMPGEGRTAMQLNQQWRNSDVQTRRQFEREERGSGGPILRDPKGIKPPFYMRKDTNSNQNDRGGRGGPAGFRCRDRGGITRGDFRGGRGGRGQWPGGRGNFNNNNNWRSANSAWETDYGQDQDQGSSEPESYWELNNKHKGIFGEEDVIDYADSADSFGNNQRLGGESGGKVLRFSRNTIPQTQSEFFPPSFESQTTEFPPAPFPSSQEQSEQLIGSSIFQNESSKLLQQQQQVTQSLLSMAYGGGDESPSPWHTPTLQQQTQSIAIVPPLFPLSSVFQGLLPTPPPPPPPEPASNQSLLPLPFHLQQKQDELAPNPLFQAVQSFNKQEVPSTNPFQQEHAPAVSLPYEVSANSYSNPFYTDSSSVPESPWYSGLPVQPQAGRDNPPENPFDGVSETSSDKNPWYTELIPDTKEAKAKYLPHLLEKPKKVNPFAMSYQTQTSSSGGFLRGKGQEKHQQPNKQNEVVSNPFFKTNFAANSKQATNNDWNNRNEWNNQQQQSQNYGGYSSNQQQQSSSGPKPLMAIPLMDSDQLGGGSKPFQYQNQSRGGRGGGRGQGNQQQWRGKVNSSQANPFEGGQNNNQNPFISKQLNNYNNQQQQQGGGITNRLMNISQDGGRGGQHQQGQQRPGTSRVPRTNFNLATAARNGTYKNNTTATNSTNAQSNNKKTGPLLPTPKLIPYPPPPLPKPVDRNPQPKGILKETGKYAENFVQPGYFENEKSGIVAYDEDDDDDEVEYLGDVPMVAIKEDDFEDMSHDFFSAKVVHHFTSLLKGKSVEDQVEGLLSYILLASDFLTSRVGIVRNLHLLLTEKYHKCTLSAYGADYIGVGNSDDSVNIFVDLTGKQGPSLSTDSNQLNPSEISRETVDELLGLLRQDDGKEHELFGQIVKRTNFGRINLPVISFVHKGTRVRCNLRFENYFLVQEAKVLQFLTSLDIRIIPLLAIVRYWSSVHKVLDTPEEDTKNRFISLLLLFFLARKKIVPTMAHLQSLSVKQEYFENVDVGFCNNNDLVPKNENSVLEDKNLFTLSTLSLLKEFFKLFASADLKKEVVSLWQAEFIPKDNFTPNVEAHLLSPELRKRYRYGANGKLRDRRLDCSSRLCVQDFQDLTENLTLAIPEYDCSRFQIECQVAVTRLENLMSGSGDMMDLFVLTEYGT